jgi:hypothetical protein
MTKPKDDQNNLSKCICEKCSVYNECNKSKAEKLFCARQKTNCNMDTKKMCICGMCPVYNQDKLKGGYFCANENNN